MFVRGLNPRVRDNDAGDDYDFSSGSHGSCNVDKKIFYFRGYSEITLLKKRNGIYEAFDGLYHDEIPMTTNFLPVKLSVIKLNTTGSNRRLFSCHAEKSPLASFLNRCRKFSIYWVCYLFVFIWNLSRLC